MAGGDHPFGDLTLGTDDVPSGAATVFDALGRRRLRATLRINGRLATRQVAQTWRLAREALLNLARSQPAVAIRVLGEPTVACFAHQLLETDIPAADRASFDRHLRALSLGLLLELAASGNLSNAVAVDVRGAELPQLCSVAANIHIALRSGVQKLRFRSGQVELAAPPDGLHIDLSSPATTGVSASEPARLATVTRPYCAVWEHVHLALVDNSPTRLFSNHPDQPTGRRFGLGDSPVDVWRDRFSDAFSLVARLMPTLAADWRIHARLVLPVGDDAEKHFSATYPGMPSAAYMSLHPDLMTVAEAVIHELQHDKLHAAERLQPLLNNAPGARYASPLRPDLRPMRGVLLAAHAFVPVAVFHRRLAAQAHPITAKPRWRRRFDAVLAANADAIDVLKGDGRPTDAGHALLARLYELDASTRA